MKRKEIIEAIDEIATATYKTHGTMEIFNDSTGECVDVDLPSVLAVTRGVLVWVLEVLEGRIEPEGAGFENLRFVLSAVGASIVQTIKSEDEDDDED